ncbi:MAG: hypothetical protein JHC40_08655 [Burkholderiales bacterium]|jgi:hypothetical protein|nr:hypothetical protein [Burkholderiales bacterium]
MRPAKNAARIEREHASAWGVSERCRESQPYGSIELTALRDAADTGR